MSASTTTDLKPSSTPTRRKRTRRSEAEWLALIREFEQSDMTQSAFCQQHGVATSGLNLWRKRLARDHSLMAANEPTPAPFVPVDLCADSSEATVDADSDRRWELELTFAPGCTLKLSRVR